MNLGVALAADGKTLPRSRAEGLLAVAAFGLESSRFLDVAEMTTAVALGTIV
jgi:hypothetical protein